MLRWEAPNFLSDLRDWRYRSFLLDNKSFLVGDSARKTRSGSKRGDRCESVMGKDWLRGWENWEFGKRRGCNEDWLVEREGAGE